MEREICKASQTNENGKKNEIMDVFLVNRVVYRAYTVRMHAACMPKPSQVAYNVDIGRVPRLPCTNSQVCAVKQFITITHFALNINAE